jgi:hypothetical protein
VFDLVKRSIQLDGELCVICITVCLNTRNSLLEIGNIWKLVMEMLQGNHARDATHDGLKNVP